jgi:hypothetical protein
MACFTYTPAWDPHGPKWPQMGPHGTHMAPNVTSWPVNGIASRHPHGEPAWPQRGPHLGPHGLAYETLMGPILGPRCDPSPKWVPLGARRVAEGPQMGLHLGPQMETVGPHMDPIPALNEKSSTRRGTRTRTTWGPITGP